MTTENSTKTYTLKVTETNNKAGKFHYQVIDDTTGEVISERRSNREYVACTINGSYYFGRLDLIGKGEHGTQVKSCQGFRQDYDKAKRKWVWVADESRKREQTPIAYKK